MTLTVTSPDTERLASDASAWGAAPQEGLARAGAPAYEALLGRLGVAHNGESWLDIATGTGPMARRAARAGASVVAFDFASELVEIGRRLAADVGLGVRFAVHAIEDHRYVPEEFQVVSSAFGVMYAHDHKRAAERLSMLCHPSGRIGLLAWTPSGWMAEAHALTVAQPSMLPMPTTSPFLWGDPDYVDALLGDVFDLESEPIEVPLSTMSGEAVWELFVGQDGPTRTVATALGPDELGRYRESFVGLAEAARVRFSIPRSALVTVGHRRR